ncbi:Hypothetical_protein [Hexamita inflata]|uniref:Hypothetical_protein n=1 Tax=Hexamita inflata TaxID=28002 RepID=A0AA86NLE8_9EUKA|nr:Hypothetical protein HINF_LOCUS10002 [Hexamita inflata]
MMFEAVHSIEMQTSSGLDTQNSIKISYSWWRSIQAILQISHKIIVLNSKFQMATRGFNIYFAHHFRRDSLGLSIIISARRANLTLTPLSWAKLQSTYEFLLNQNNRFQDTNTIRASQFYQNSSVNLSTNIELLPATLNLAVAQILTTS